MIPIVVLISGNGTNLQAIIDKCHMKTVEIVAVISDQYGAYGIKRAQEAGIEVDVVKQTPTQTREEHCDELRDLIFHYNPRLIVLAGFMKILTSNFFIGMPDILNIHPSLLPKFKGLNTHQRVIEEGESEHGITIHLVNEGLDSGPIIFQRRIPVNRGDTAELLEERIHILEHLWYPDTISILANYIGAK